MPAVLYPCPSCGAPLDLSGGASVVLCIYCRQTSRIILPGATSQPGAPVEIVKHEVSSETTDRVVALVIAGKRDEAIALYARAAAIPAAEAEKVVAQISMLAVTRLAKNLPMRPLGVPVGLVILGLLGFAARFEVHRLMRGSVLAGVLLVALALITWFFLAMFLRRLRSAFVMRWGIEGDAEVLRMAMVDPTARTGRSLVVVQMRVRPLAGSAPFEHAEPMLVRPDCVPRLAVGNVVRVRFDAQRTLVFPPHLPDVEVVGSATR